MAMAAPLRSALELYARWSDRAPISTNALVGGVIMLFGDASAQLASGDRDAKRLAVAVGWNGVVATPLFRLWFAYLDKTVVRPKGFAGAVVKSTVNLLFMSPIVNAAYIVASTLVEAKLDGRSLEADGLPLARARVRNDALQIVLSSAAFWGPVNLLNFAYVPPKFRVLPSVFGGVAWGGYLSYVGHRTHLEPASPEPKPSSHETALVTRASNRDAIRKATP